MPTFVGEVTLTCHPSRAVSRLIEDASSEKKRKVDVISEYDRLIEELQLKKRRAQDEKREQHHLASLAGQHGASSWQCLKPENQWKKDI